MTRDEHGPPPMITTSPEHPVTHRVSAIASCAFCSYLAQLTGDSAIEVVMTLRGLLLDHLRQEHPDLIEREPS